jgi:Na+/melibiose symporter-like transporter
MAGTLANRNVAFILAAAFFLYAGIGLNFAINLYFATYFWAFSAAEIGLFAFSSLTAAVLAFLVAPQIARRFDKRPAAMILLPLGLSFTVGPVLLRLAGAFPSNDSPTIFGVIFVTNMLTVCLGIMANILFSSMIADVVEDAELKTGRRQEGLFFAAIAFANKSTTGLGIFASGLIVSAVGFPTGARPGEVAPEVLRSLGLVYAPAMVALYGAAILLLFGYRITRASHMETLRKLAAAADLASEGEPASADAKLG